MYKLNKYHEIEDIIELIDEENRVWLKVAPERGGIITGFGVNGQEILYMNEETLKNRSKSIHGGIPILFPIAGQLKANTFKWGNKIYMMSPHGVARKFSWEPMEVKTGDAKASLKLRFVSNEKTKEAFPFDYEIIFTYQLEDNKLTIYQEYHNLSQIEMPMTVGFHPYFKISKKKNLEYEIAGNSYLDYKDFKLKAYSGNLDMTGEGDSKIFSNLTKDRVAFYDRVLDKKITLDYSPEFKHLVLWSEVGKDFICVEPWTAKPDSLNTKEDLLYVKPNEVSNLFLRISCNHL